MCYLRCGRCGGSSVFWRRLGHPDVYSYCEDCEGVNTHNQPAEDEPDDEAPADRRDTFPGRPASDGSAP